MSLELDYPALTAMLNAHLRDNTDGDEAAVEAFVALAGDPGKDAVVAELDRFCATQHDPDELRAYLLIHRFSSFGDGRHEEWFVELRRLLERTF